VIFRREPIHKKLARQARLEGELDARFEPPPVDPGPHWGATGIHGVPRPRRWDVVASAEAPGLRGDDVHFVSLPNGDLIVDEDEPEDTVTPLADALEETVQPPYRAEAVRRSGDVWAVAARLVQVAELDAPGNEIELVANADGRTLAVDGRREFGSIPELERLGEDQGDSYVVRARRLDERLWEVEVDPL
jgi:hypothetical protein